MKRYIIAAIYVVYACASLYAQEYTTISDEKNAPSSTGKGGVNYNYEIGTAEVTNLEYCLFLNSVAVHDNSMGLYSKLMTQHPFGGIVRSVNSNGAYYYAPKTGFENKPVTCVTWYSAIRYVNWLHYNAKRIEEGSIFFLPYTEGSATTGAYNTSDFGTRRAITTCAKRNEGAIYWLPNEDEWIKAAYYNSKTKKWQEEVVHQGSNCYDLEKGWAFDYPHIKDVKKSVEAAASGTYDQQGNAAEWIENCQGEWRIALGGSLIRPRKFASINEHEGDAPDKAIASFGFRVCRTNDLKKRTNEPKYVETIQKQDKIEALITDKNGGVYVLCDDAGNKGDIVNQYKGYVGYDFYIAKFELTNSEYCHFLNAVARTGDPYKLYNENMSRSICGGIDRISKGDTSYYYIVKDGYERKPVVYIHYCDLARYANWLHYGCPNTGKSEIGTTEGDASNGAYNTTDFEDVRSGKKTVYEEWGKRNVGAKYFIPSEDEWYKAAYYDPTIIGGRKYHDYPTRTSDAPAYFQANYLVGDSILNPKTFIVDVDCFPNAASYFGTQQQGGNVWEWTEDWQYGIVGCRGLRGGSWSYTSYGLNAINMDPGGLDDYSYVFGARLCKAKTDTGWYPITKPTFERFVEWWTQLSYYKILLFTGLFIIAIVYTLISLFYFAVKLLKHGHKSKA